MAREAVRIDAARRSARWRASTPSASAMARHARATSTRDFAPMRRCRSLRRADAADARDAAPMAPMAAPFIDFGGRDFTGSSAAGPVGPGRSGRLGLSRRPRRAQPRRLRPRRQDVRRHRAEVSEVRIPDRARSTTRRYARYKIGTTDELHQAAKILEPLAQARRDTSTPSNGERHPVRGRRPRLRGSATIDGRAHERHRGRRRSTLASTARSPSAAIATRRRRSPRPRRQPGAPATSEDIQVTARGAQRAEPDGSGAAALPARQAACSIARTTARRSCAGAPSSCSAGAPTPSRRRC